MTQLRPTLRVNELIVVKDGHHVLRVPFHKGLNIVSGHNSSGKTTTLDFIAFTLGAEEIPWKKEALLCDYSLLEVSLNDTPVVLRRDVSEERQRPLHIFWGTLANALAAPFTDWQSYPFRRSQSKLSFTQTLLLALGMPEAQGDGTSNLTMHQFLRVMYADQPSLHSPIFRIDEFDNALTRETVGNYLSGVYDDELYSSQLRKRELEKKISEAESELRSIFTVLAKSQQEVRIDLFSQEILVAEQRRAELAAELSRLKTERTVRTDGKRGRQNESVARSALDSAKRELNAASEKLAKLEAELEDSRAFVKEVGARLVAIDQSQDTREYLGSVAFAFCPCCLNEVAATNDSASCALCKSPLHSGAGEAQLLRMRNELRIQAKESQALIEARESDAAKLRLSIPGMKQEFRRLERNYLQISQNWTTELEEQIEQTSRALGGIDQEIKALYESQRLAGVVKELQNKRDQLRVQLAELESRIESLAYSQETRKREVTLAISQATSRLLKEDLYRQAEFKTADSVKFSFSENTVTVDGSSRFSESSTVVLRHLFHVALLTASVEQPEMRFPRFLILDGIEDGGIELPRAHRLQEIIAEECSTYKVDFQLIMATSQIAPSLRNSRIVVGREFTEERRALEMR